MVKESGDIPFPQFRIYYMNVFTVTSFVRPGRGVLLAFWRQPELEARMIMSW